MYSLAKSLSEFIPLVIFFIAFKINGMIFATECLVISTIISVAINYLFFKKLSPVLILSSMILIILGGITIVSGNSDFVKLKPTVINLVFSGILLHGLLKKQGYLKYIFKGSVAMSEGNWMKLSVRWVLFFLLMAMVNEAVWRNFSDDIWIKFKLFGSIPLNIMFALAQIPFILRNKTN